MLVAIARAIGLGEVIDHPLQEELAESLAGSPRAAPARQLRAGDRSRGLGGELLSDCPRLKVLVTSREALHVRAEQIYPVPPLTLPPAGAKRASAKEVESCEAAQLFIDRAQAIRPDFD